MKKILISFAVVCFVAFVSLGIQSVEASADNVEVVNLHLDDDPDKNKTAEAKADGKDKKAEKCSKTSKSNCKDASAKCETKKDCSSKSTKCGDKKSGGDKK